MVRFCECEGCGDLIEVDTASNDCECNECKNKRELDLDTVDYLMKKYGIT